VRREPDPAVAVGGLLSAAIGAVLSLLALLLLPFLVQAAALAADHGDAALSNNEEVVTGRRVTLADQELRDLLVAAQTARLDRLSLEDLVLAVGRAELTTVSTENLLLLAGRADLRDMSIRQGFFLGNSIDYEGEVASDLAVAAGWVTLGPQTLIAGRLRVAAARFRQEGQLLGDLVVVARQVTLAGEISGNLRILAERITLAPGAIIHGDITYRSLQDIQIDKDATVLGSVTRVEPRLTLPSLAVVFLIGLTIWAAAMLATFLLGGSLQIVAPHLMTRPACAIESHPLKTTLVGALVLFGVPLVGVLLAASFYALPLAIMILPLYWAGTILAFLAFAYWAGLHLLGRPGLCWKTPSLARRLAALLLALVVVTLAGAVLPVLGLAILLIGTSAGLGAYLLPPPNSPPNLRG
jgi:hypothetical protein